MQLQHFGKKKWQYPLKMKVNFFSPYMSRLKNSIPQIRKVYLKSCKIKFASLLYYANLIFISVT